jgi:hypothetical protein
LKKSRYSTIDELIEGGGGLRRMVFSRVVVVLRLEAWGESRY